MADDYVGYISFYYSREEEYPVPEGEPGFAGKFWTWGRYGARQNENCCRCRLREGLLHLIGTEGAPVYYITKWRGGRYLTGRVVWGEPARSKHCSGYYDKRRGRRGWCWAYKSMDVRFVAPYRFDGALFLNIFGENQGKSSHIHRKRIRRSHAVKLDRIFRNGRDCTRLCEDLYLK